MTTPMTRDEIVELMANIVGQHSFTPYTIVTDILNTLEAAGCQIVQGEPVAYYYEHPYQGMEFSSFPLDEPSRARGWAETPLFAGKVQP